MDELYWFLGYRLFFVECEVFPMKHFVIRGIEAAEVVEHETLAGHRLFSLDGDEGAASVLFRDVYGVEEYSGVLGKDRDGWLAQFVEGWQGASSVVPNLDDDFVTVGQRLAR